MLKTGTSFLQSLDDGRRIMLGSEEVRNPARHPAFRRTAATLADTFDRRASEANNGVLWVRRDGEAMSLFYHVPCDRNELRTRTLAHKWVSDASFGLFGRSFDHVASFLTGLAMCPSAFSGQERAGFDTNFARFFAEARRADLNLAYAVLPSAGTRGDAVARADNAFGLRIVEERDDGIVVSGAKCLATGAVFADAVWLGNLQPLRQQWSDEALTCVLPLGTSGLVISARRPTAPAGSNTADYPLSQCFDESDAVIVCDRVRVPWEAVFVLRDAQRSQEVYTNTPSHVLGNHQSNVRFWSKLQFILGLAWRMSRMSGIGDVPAVRERLGRLAAQEAIAASLIEGQIQTAEQTSCGMCYNRRGVYAFLNWSNEVYAELISELRDISGAMPVQLPAERPQAGTDAAAEARYELYRLAWEMIGSEYAGRQAHYERFFAGPQHVVRSHSYREADWDSFDAVVERALQVARDPSLAGNREGHPRDGAA